MTIRQITPEYFVAGQLEPEDLPEIAAAVIRTVICNRPDAEVPPSHQAAAIGAAAEAAGLTFEVQPLTHQSFTGENLARHRALADGGAPCLAYCASGTRSTIAWALTEAGARPVDEIIALARNAGYDLENIRPTLEAAAQK